MHVHVILAYSWLATVTAIKAAGTAARYIAMHLVAITFSRLQCTCS